MKKKGNSDGEGAEAAVAEDGATSRRPAKKTAKRPAATKKKPPAKKPSGGGGGAKKGRGKKGEPEAAEAADASAGVAAIIEEIEQAANLVPEAELLDEDIVDADIVSETIVARPEAPVEAAEETTEPERELSDEEKELAAVYGEDLASPSLAHAEFKDKQSADEDRPMMPEINAREERKQRWEERRDRRRQRRDERQQRRENRGGEQRPGQEARPEGQQRHEGRPQGHEPRPSEHRHGERPRPPVPPPGGQMPLPINGHAADGQAIARVGTPLGDAAATLFAQLRNGQPLPVRQLAAMMRKRNLVEREPDQVWPQLKAELLGDERSYRSLGLRPRIVYRGRDLFAPGPVATSATADAEAGVANALSRLQSATHRALADRVAKASPAGFERLIHAYLVAAGYRDIEWVKRVGGIAYASALAPGIERTILISARSGDQAIDRRGIGELRVGVEAKNLVAGILFSARELSEDAERELERAGRSIAVVCGDQLVAVLVNAGVGVVSSAAPLHYLDEQLLDELLAG